MSRPVLIVKTGSTLPAIAARRGDFEDWITEGMGVARDDVRVSRVDQGEALPPPDEIGAVVVTGSAAMVSAREPWSERTGEWLARAVDGRTPVLGICYGHQLLAHALGGEVGLNPRGREIGTIEVELTEEGRRDALLGILPPRFRVQATHMESVLALPRGARVLAQNALDPHQAFVIGDRVWAVQFHPEADADAIRGYIEARAEKIRDEGLDPEALIAAATDTEHGTAILRRFAELSGVASGAGRPA